MINFTQLRKLDGSKILMLGNHSGVVQSILDYDFLVGKKTPSIVGIVGVQQRLVRYFWGHGEILLPGFVSLGAVAKSAAKEANLFVNVQSGRRAINTSEEALRKLPSIIGGMIFAEGVPEQHALHLRQVAQELDKFVLGPASVGLVIGGSCKLGPIGGTLPEQIMQAGILDRGDVAVISSSGGMVNEIINSIAANGSRISFAAAVGGERYPLVKPVELVDFGLKDKGTKAIVYFGELGGNDEYDIVDLYKKTRTKKPFLAYIAGTVAENFDTAPQFGHAKSLAQNQAETASAKKKALHQAGVEVANSFAQFEAKLAKLPKSKTSNQDTQQIRKESLAAMEVRTRALFVNRVSSDKGGEVQILGSPLLDFVSDRSLSYIALSMFLGREPSSQRLVKFFDLSVRLLVDHGPQVSGAVNTMITTRAGKDLTAALASGILTIGPRFGGAVSQAATGWFEAVNSSETPEAYVERFAKNKTYIAGIGHKKYRQDNPDPRVSLLLDSFDKGGRYTTFAKAVAGITVRKKSLLILNVDGAIAALLLDILSRDEHLSPTEISDLLATDFCNAIFVFARSIGLIAHHLEQQRLDEGLFRLPDEHISSVN